MSYLLIRFNSNQNTSIQQKDEIRNLAYTSLDIALLECPTIKKLRNRLTGNNTRVILFKKLVRRKNNLILQLYFSAN
ncbi:hypothetical protein RIR_jg42130.t1 [Rhizophagus irregularis DAOM 181602=DAOM 197198]|nr:hypothetical protein RIR_jg42130.t1 [Rhizophagus irregularis DAOM 181602=DAOM 197198]